MSDTAQNSSCKAGANTIDHSKAPGAQVTYNGGNDPSTNNGSGKWDNLGQQCNIKYR